MRVWRVILRMVVVLVKSGSSRGDGSVYGMSKEYRNLVLNKK